MKVAANGLSPVVMLAAYPPSFGHHGGVIRCPVGHGTVQGLMVPVLAHGVAHIGISVGAAIRLGYEGLGR
jgi:hypothetical protein